MHLEGLVWCNQHGTDGHIPGYALRRITDEEDPHAAASRLVAVGLWEATGDGWSIVGFLDDQPSAAEVRQQRDESKTRKKRWELHHRKDNHSLCLPKNCPKAERAAERVTERVTNHGSNDPPTRPEPSRPEGAGRLGEGDGGSTSGGLAALATPEAPPPPENEPIPWLPGMLPPGVVPSVHVVNRKPADYPTET